MHFVYQMKVLEGFVNGMRDGQSNAGGEQKPMGDVCGEDNDRKNGGTEGQTRVEDQRPEGEEEVIWLLLDMVFSETTVKGL